MSTVIFYVDSQVVNRSILKDYFLIGLRGLWTLLCIISGGILLNAFTVEFPKLAGILLPLILLLVVAVIYIGNKALNFMVNTETQTMTYSNSANYSNVLPLWSGISSINTEFKSTNPNSYLKILYSKDYQAKNYEHEAKNHTKYEILMA